MPGTLTPTCSFCGLRFAGRPLLELHIREDHLQRDHHLEPVGSRASARGVFSGGGISQRRYSRPSSRSRRRVSWGRAGDWLSCPAAAAFWMARAVKVSAPRSIIQAPSASGQVRATTGTPACLAAAHAAAQTAVSSGSSAAGSGTSSRPAACLWIARHTRPASSAAGGVGGDVRQVGAAPLQVQAGRVGGGERLQVVDHAGQPQYLIAQ
jgi:hypothetical protein